MAYGQQLKSEDKESAIYKLTSAYTSGMLPKYQQRLLELHRKVKGILTAPASLKSSIYSWCQWNTYKCKYILAAQYLL